MNETFTASHKLQVVARCCKKGVDKDDQVMYTIVNIKKGGIYMNEMQVFTNPEFGKVRTVVIDNEPWFVGKDVAVALGYSNQRDALSRHVDTEDKTSVVIPDTGSNYKSKATLINESGLYSLILSSKLPTAKKFKRWVTSEVLPSIRKHGAYMTPETIEKTLLTPDFIIKLATELKEEREKVKVLAPKAGFYDTVANSESLLSMGDVAKTLDMGIGRNKLFALLRDKGVLNQHNIPYQRYIDAGYFKLIENTFMAGDNQVVSTTTYVKQKGIDYIRKVLTKEGYDKANNA